MELPGGEKKKSVSRNNPEKQAFCRTSIKHNATSCLLKVNWIITQAETEVCPTILEKKIPAKTVWDKNRVVHREED